MTVEKKDDEKLEKLLRANRPVVPAAPRDELALLAAKLENKNVARVKGDRPWYRQQWVALAACLALVMSVFLINQSRAPTGEEVAEALASFAYSLEADDESTEELLASYPLDELLE